MAIYDDDAMIGTTASCAVVDNAHWYSAKAKQSKAKEV